MTAAWIRQDVEPITVVLECAFGANLISDPSTWTWTDISTRMKGTARIVRGRADESSLTQPSRCTIRLLNTDSWLTPRHTVSPWYNTWALGTPMRIKVRNNRTGVSFIRCQGGVTSITPIWPAENSGYAIVEVEFSGVLFRLGQGQDVKSIMYRGLSSDKPVRYWPMEDGSDAVSLAEFNGGPPIRFTGGPPSLASKTPVTGASAPVMTSADTTRAYAPVKMPGTVSAWTIEWYMNLSSAGPNAVNYIWEWQTSGTVRRWRLTTFNNAGVDTIRLEGWGTNDVAVLPTFEVPFSFDGVSEAYGEDIWISVAARDGSGTVQFEFQGRRPDGSRFFKNNGSVAGVFGRGGIYRTAKPAAGPSGWSFGHLAIWNRSLDTSWGTCNFPHASLLNGNNGELADVRINTMATAAGVAFAKRTPGPVNAPSSSLGYSPIGSPLTVMREAEKADMGIITDGLNSGIDYLPRSRRFNLPVALTLDAAVGHIKRGFNPVENDQRLRNTQEVHRTRGSSATAQLAAAVATQGIYSAQETVNIASDDELDDQAWFRLNLSNVPEMRIPVLNVDLRDQPGLIQPWLDNCDIGVRYTATNLMTQYTPAILDQVLEQYTETLDAVTWKLELVGTPFAPWRVFIVEDATAGRCDTAGSKLTSLVSTTATSWSVTTTDGPIWTTTDFPFDIDCEGEQVRVTNVTGGSSPQTFTVTRSINGVVKAHAANALLSLWRPAVVAF